MRLEKVELDKLKEAAYNPRVKLEPGMDEYEKLRKSIETFGDVEPIVWNQRTGNVVGGHQRLQVLRDLGKKEATVSVVDMDEAAEKRLNLALNKARGDWDGEKLETLLSEMDPDALEVSGFGADEVAILLENNDGVDDWDGDDGDDDWQEGVNLYGASFVVTLRFKDIEKARTWIQKEGLDAALQEGSHTTVIRFGEEA
nr:ParB N-terminal domain-containing protein [Mitsuokella multacida]